MNYWQIGSGAFNRDYAAYFIRYGMAFVGGDKYVKTMDSVELDDRIILKKGNAKVIAVGKVVKRNGRHGGKDDKEWLRDFDGWDLRAYCFVQWHVLKEPIVTKGLTRATINKVKQGHLRELAEKTLSTVAPLQESGAEPRPTREVEDEEILDFLIQEGLRPGAAEELTATFNRIRLLARYYYKHEQVDWSRVREHETRTFLVVPLLLALGWAEQQIKIELPLKERRRADVACFPKPYVGKDTECVLMLETKGFNQGLDYAPDQAKKYADYLPKCQIVVVTNGYCYKAFGRLKDGSFSTKPAAYLNLVRPRDRYPLDPDHVDGCLETLRLLLPSSYM